MIKKLFKYVYLKFKYGKFVLFHFSSDIGLGSIIEGNNKLGPRAYFWGTLGKGTYIGRDSEIVGSVGRFTSIASNCKVLHGIHPYTYPFATTSPLFYSTQKVVRTNYANRTLFIEQKFADDVHKYPVVIGNDCWINGNVTIAPGVTIGDGAVLLAGSIITKDVPPYALVGGVPARVIKYRYSENDINFLMNIKWWNQDDKWLRENWECLANIELLKKKFEGR